MMRRRWPPFDMGPTPSTVEVVPMPTYSYTCHACDDGFDLRVPMEARDDQRCACGAAAVRRITAVALTGRAVPAAHVPDIPLRRRLPSSWQGVGASREGVAHFQRLEERLARHEARNPELQDNRMPIVAHEGGKIVHATKKSGPPQSPPGGASPSSDER
ncbi:zinc ribbon domain-containing protein [Microbacterium sp. LMC-P-041]|uniref:FmdB family zinc ribbon protein n=1 Tax=Microbacterium sp. LMC-P-041 TaxID=3040293 RepID=UPI003306867D